MHFVFWLPLLGTPPSSTSHPSPDWTSRWQLHWYGNPGLINDPIIIGILRSIMGVINNPQKGNHLPARVYPLFDPPSEEKRAAVVSENWEHVHVRALFIRQQQSEIVCDTSETPVWRALMHRHSCSFSLRPEWTPAFWFMGCVSPVPDPWMNGPQSGVGGRARHLQDNHSSFPTLSQLAVNKLWPNCVPVAITVLPDSWQQR